MNNRKFYTCSFFGHRIIKITPDLEKKIESIIENLIVDKGVLYFLFGSKSMFNDLCYSIVTKLKYKYSNIKRVVYLCRSEGATLEKEKEEKEKSLSFVLGKNVKLNGYDKIIELEKLFYAGKASYVERNYEMIKNSDYCVFYYSDDYVNSNMGIRSGTHLAFKYAKQKNKQIVNVV